MTDAEFAEILADPSKVIAGDLVWKPDADHSPSCEFSAEIQSDVGWPIVVRGSYNPIAGKLTFAVIHRSDGRIYALDLGARHHNVDGHWVGDTHKHRWAEATADKHAYEPEDITASVTDAVQVWRQFCTEAHIRHLGELQVPPPGQDVLFA